MTFTAGMRVGSLEILGALAAFGFIAARMRAAPAPARPTQVHLSLAISEGVAGTSPRETSLTVADGAPCVIGRSGEAEIGLSDPDVSRRHARLELVRGVLYVVDLGSRNGTFLNGKSLEDEGIEVRVGDDIDVGNTRITVMGTAPSS